LNAQGWTVDGVGFGLFSHGCFVDESEWFYRLVRLLSNAENTSARIAARVNMATNSANPPQRGAVTHHHDHEMTPHNLSVIKTMARRPKKLLHLEDDDDELLMTIDVIGARAGIDTDISFHWWRLAFRRPRI
jgi:hypothetical protein